MFAQKLLTALKLDNSYDGSTWCLGIDLRTALESRACRRALHETRRWEVLERSVQDS